MLHPLRSSTLAIFEYIQGSVTFWEGEAHQPTTSHQLNMATKFFWPGRRRDVVCHAITMLLIETSAQA